MLTFDLEGVLRGCELMNNLRLWLWVPMRLIQPHLSKETFRKIVISCLVRLCTARIKNVICIWLNILSKIMPQTTNMRFNCVCYSLANFCNILTVRKGSNKSHFFLLSSFILFQHWRKVLRQPGWDTNGPSHRRGHHSSLSSFLSLSFPLSPYPSLFTALACWRSVRTVSVLIGIDRIREEGAEWSLYTAARSCCYSSSQVRTSLSPRQMSLRIKHLWLSWTDW